MNTKKMLSCIVVLSLVSMQATFANRERSSVQSVSKIRKKMSTEPKYVHITRPIKSGDSFKTRIKWLVNLIEDVSYLPASEDKKILNNTVNSLNDSFQRNARAFFTDKSGKIIAKRVKKVQKKLTGTYMRHANDNDFHTKFVKDLSRLYKREGTRDTHGIGKQLATIEILSRILPDFKYAQATFPSGTALKQYGMIEKEAGKLLNKMNTADRNTWNEIKQNFFSK